MYDPSGPLSRGVYFRRRVGALAGAVLALVMLIWVVDGVLGDGGDTPIQGVASSSWIPPEKAPTSRVVPSSRQAAPSSGAVAPSASAAPRPGPKPEQVPPNPSAPCPDASVAVVAETGKPAYPVGRRPLLRLVITNTGPVPCTRDVGRALRELVVTSRDGKTRVWSSNDCYFGPRTASPRVLEPGERQEFQVKWAGRTSVPGCPTRRDAVVPGEYSVVPALGPLAGKPAPFRLTP